MSTPGMKNTITISTLKRRTKGLVIRLEESLEVQKIRANQSKNRYAIPHTVNKLAKDAIFSKLIPIRTLGADYSMGPEFSTLTSKVLHATLPPLLGK